MDFGLLAKGFGSVFTFDVMFMIFLGNIAGIMVGALPGLTATMGVALLVPLTFGLPLITSLSMLMGIYTGAMYGGSISAILIRTPGTPAAAATILEGYPLAQKGEAGRALAMSLFSSFTGGLMGVAIMTFLSPQVSKMALKFGTAEYFSLAIFGLSVIISISGGAITKGLMSGLFGLTIATVGFDPISGFPRFTLGFTELLEGPPFIPTLIGLFAFAEVLKSIEDLGVVQRIKCKVKRAFPSKEDLKLSWKELIKSGLIGTFIGSIPGAGGDIASFVAYGEAKRASKYPEKFGTGVIEALGAVESANNACQGGAMIPLLSLGVPGDAVTAVLLGAFVIQGLQPGPLLYKDHLDIVYAIFASMIVAQFVMLFVGALGINLFNKIIEIEKKVLIPAICVLSLVGAYAMRNNIFDVYLTIIFGVIGYLMQRYGFPLSPILLALILGPMAESNLRRTMVIFDNNPLVFLTRPISLALLLLAVVSLVISVINQRKIEKRLAEQSLGQ